MDNAVWLEKAGEATAKVVAVQRIGMMQSSAL